MSDDFVYSQIFEPPEDKWGQVCVASALSADEFFIDKALRTFTKKDERNRALNRCYSLYLMLNKGHRQLDKSVSGFYQLEPSSREKWKKVYIQHAKVAVMQFGSSQMRQDFFVDDNTIWRLVVCTGNWTEESAKHQIELVWSIDVPFNCENEQDIIDLLEAVKFLKSLRFLYDCCDNIWERAELMFSKIEKHFSSFLGKSTEARFISTLPMIENEQDVFQKNGTSLFEQIQEITRGKSYGLNTFVIGSGFYEKANGASKPKVIEKIENFIKNTGFENDTQKYIVLNENNAGQLANWSDNSEWELHSAFDPSEKNRSLHAKYIFAGKYEKSILNGWMYLGSGNLSIQGVLSAYGNADGRTQGNIEAGVVFDIKEKASKTKFFENFLACTKDRCTNALKSGDGSNQDEPEDEFIPPSPIMAIKRLSDANFEVIWNLNVVGSQNHIQFKINDEQVNALISGKNYLWEKWGFNALNLPQWAYIEYENQKYQVPLLDSEGSLVEIKQSIKDIDEFLELMDNFPSNEDDPDSIEGGDRPDPPGTGTSVKGERITCGSYPCSDAMKIIEKIAELNNRYFPDASKSNEGFLRDWIFDLENRVKSIHLDIQSQLKSVNIDFISVLKNPQGFAPQLSDKLRPIWNEFVDRWSHEWGLDSSNKLWEG